MLLYQLVALPNKLIFDPLLSKIKKNKTKSIVILQNVYMLILNFNL